jgi:5-oxoprolinase (ATP-hydrolysing) subunit A
MAHRINLNADLGEGFGAWDLGDDSSMIGIVRSINVACGLHAGDPVVMRRVALEAKANGVSIGAHPGFDDLRGFGRRQIRMPADELEYLVAYQIGALKAMACYAGVPVTHVKPHGALNNMAAEDEAYAMAIGRAIKTVDRDLIFLALAGSEMEKAARRLDLPLAREAFADRTYEDDGNLTPRSVNGSVLRDADLAAERVVRMVQDGVITSRHGKKLEVGFESLCVHGDEPTAVGLARLCRETLEQEGIEIVTLPELLG